MSHESLPVEHWLNQPHATVAFTPSEGFCCTAYRVELDGQWCALLAEPPSWEALHARPAFFGNPLLFPYAFGISNGRLDYRGQSYQLQPGRHGRVAHGLVRDHAWTVDAVWDDADGSHIRARIRTAGSPALLAEYPFPFELTTTYTLAGTSLTAAFEATNLGDQLMPLGLGIHPYFPLPLLPGTALGDWVVRSDVIQVLDAGAGPMPPDDPTAHALDLRTGRTCDEILRANPRAASGGALHVTYAKTLGLVGATCEPPLPGIIWTMMELERGLALEIRTSQDFQAMVLFAPPDARVLSPVISTNLPEAFNLAAAGQPSGLIELEPGQVWRGWARFSVRID